MQPIRLQWQPAVSASISARNLVRKIELTRKDIRMKNSLVIIMSVFLLSVATGLTIGTAYAASAHDEFAASVDGGKLPPCPSMFKCRVE